MPQFSLVKALISTTRSSPQFRAPLALTELLHLIREFGVKASEAFGVEYGIRKSMTARASSSFPIAIIRKINYSILGQTKFLVCSPWQYTKSSWSTTLSSEQRWSCLLLHSQGQHNVVRQNCSGLWLPKVASVC